MSQTPQTLKNHTRWFPPFHFFVMPVLLINFLNSIRHLVNWQSRATWFELVLAAALMMLGLTARAQTIAVQDRIIRLEMRLRLQDVLPADLRPRIHELTRDQFVALRFASDAELPALVRDVLSGTVTTRKAIKERVRDWQGDYLRA
ncbi:MAG: DUF6526 family protein [Acidobacteriota bacterium]